MTETKAEEAKTKTQTFNGTGTRSLTMTPPPKSVAAVHVLIDEEWQALPISDVAVKGNQLLLSAEPSGISAVWPKGQDTVKVTSNA